jgi:tRNA threonylcarbamoyladenosine modification (KEOPS) complex  Pcc1 subunit
MKMEQAVCSETSAYKIQTPGNYPEESIQHSEHGESLKSRIDSYLYLVQLSLEIITIIIT